MRFIGRRAEIPDELLERMQSAEALTAHNTRLTLFIAFNYGGRAEIVDAAQRFAAGGEQEFRRCLYAPEMHDPDLIIRTGGEQRLSNYLLWQAAYSEFVFRPSLAGLLPPSSRRLPRGVQPPATPLRRTIAESAAMRL